MIHYTPLKQQVINPGDKIYGARTMNFTGEHGLIIVGYQGIGKSSIASKRRGIIDLESSLFKVNDNRPDDWYVIYCRIAVSLAQQGFIVLTSSHKCVVDEFDHYYGNGYYNIVIVCPYYHLKDPWIKRLQERYDEYPCTKNYIAWKDAESSFSEKITELASCSTLSHIFIDSMDYDLYSIIMGLTYIKDYQFDFSPNKNRTEGRQCEE